MLVGGRGVSGQSRVPRVVVEGVRPGAGRATTSLTVDSLVWAPAHRHAPAACNLVPVRYLGVVCLSFSLSGGFTPCRHLRPSSGREHTIV